MWLSAWSWSCTTTSPTLPRHHRREVRRSHHGAFGEALADAGSATIPSSCSWDCSCTQLVPGVQVPLPNHREYHSKHPMYGGRKKCVSPACFLTLIKNACMAWWNAFIIRAGAAIRTQYQRAHNNSSYTLPGVRKPSPIVKGKGAVRMVEHGRRSPPPFKRLDFYVRARRPSSYPSRRSNPHSISTSTATQVTLFLASENRWNMGDEVLRRLSD